MTLIYNIKHLYTSWKNCEKLRNVLNYWRTTNVNIPYILVSLEHNSEDIFWNLLSCKRILQKLILGISNFNKVSDLTPHLLFKEFHHTFCCQKQSLEVFCKICILKDLAKVKGKYLCCSLLFIEIWSLQPATFFKNKDSSTFLFM